MPPSSERSFHRAQIIANARIIFPSHDVELITTEDPGRHRRIRIISTTTGEVLLEQDGADHEAFMKLFGRSEKMIAERVKGYAGGLKSAGAAAKDRENDELSKENEVLKRQLAEKQVELVETRLATETRKNEELEMHLDVLKQRGQGSADTPAATSD